MRAIAITTIGLIGLAGCSGTERPGNAGSALGVTDAAPDSSSGDDAGMADAGRVCGLTPVKGTVDKSKLGPPCVPGETLCPNAAGCANYMVDPDDPDLGLADPYRGWRCGGGGCDIIDCGPQACCAADFSANSQHGCYAEE